MEVQKELRALAELAGGLNEEQYQIKRDMLAIGARVTLMETRLTLLDDTVSGMTPMLAKNTEVTVSNTRMETLIHIVTAHQQREHVNKWLSILSGRTKRLGGLIIALGGASAVIIGWMKFFSTKAG